MPDKKPSAWIQALREHNAKGMWCVPKKNTPEYEAVKRIMDRIKGEPVKAKKEREMMAQEDHDAPAPRKTRKLRPVKEEPKKEEPKKEDPKDKLKAFKGLKYKKITREFLKEIFDLGTIYYYLDQDGYGKSGSPEYSLYLQTAPDTIMLIGVIIDNRSTNNASTFTSSTNRSKKIGMGNSKITLAEFTKRVIKNA
jgi:hypothetical protein